VGVTGATAAVAAGHPLTARAALDALDRGGNAFDAVVAAGFVAAVAEPTLTGLAGGGFLLAFPAGGDPLIHDFFVAAPGLGAPGRAGSHGDPVTVHFNGASQVFHVGAASVAVPGCLAGYLHAHARYCRLALADLVAPAARLARAGVVLGDGQATVVRVLEPIMTWEPEGATRFGRGPDGQPFAADRVIVNEALAGFLDDVAAGRRTSFADEDLAPALVTALDAQGGSITREDLAIYHVIEREPLVVDLDGRHGSATLLTNPGPAFGGRLVGDALDLLAALPDTQLGHCGDGARLRALADVLAHITDRHRRSRGTTHVSVVDDEGNIAAMTTSNGSNSGVHLAGTGVMANNILGEEDLHPAGPGAVAPGTRIGSMMAPSVLIRPGRPTVVLGSGGSERIRSALTQTIAALLFDDLPLVDAVRAPRLHVAGGVVQLEPGFERSAIEHLRTAWPVNRWSVTDLYFGGVNAVDTAGEHIGDPRRGGVSERYRRSTAGQEPSAHMSAHMEKPA
jgi:gamma-glutamyltranspeptidase/glutathione hydrolase